MLDAGDISTADIVSDIISQAEAKEGELHAYIDFDKERLRKVVPGKGVLSGIPVAIKDNICIEGQAVTCASRMLEGFRAPYSATVIEKLKNNGAILIPRANMDEFAMGSSTENSYYGITRNPHDPKRVPGGSSGGSCTAVAGNLAIAALGSDTGGSIRQPASLCGVVGMKPTYGRVSRYGLVAFASSLDQIGPITKDVTDCAIMLGVISGHDTRDSTSANIPVPDYGAELKGDIKGMKIGLPREYFIEGMDPQVKAVIEKGIKTMEGLGFKLVDVSLPHADFGVATYYIIATAEASSNLARFDGVQYGYRAPDAERLYDMYTKTRGEGFGDEVKRRIILGTYVLSAGYYDAYYLKAQKARTLILKDFQQVFEKVDLILAPTSPTAAFEVGSRIDDPLQMYLSDIYTISVNLAGLPAVSVPCGKTGNNLPVGVQFIGRHFDEQTILKAAYAYEQAGV